MTAIGHKFVQETTRQSEVSTSFVTKASIANADITNAGDYLVFCHAHVGGSSSGSLFEFQMAQGGSVISNSLSIWEPASISSTTRGFLNYDFFTVLRNIDGSKDIQFQMRTVSAGGTAFANGIVLGIIRLDADLTEDTGAQGDWVFNENTTDSPISFFWGAFATDIITSGNEDWLVMANVGVDINDPSIGFRARINRDGTDLTPDFIHEGESSSESRNYMMARVYTLTAGPHTFSLQASVTGSTRSPDNRHVRSAIFALRLGAFDKTASAFNDAITGSAGIPVGTPGEELLSVSVTPATGGDYFIVSSGKGTNAFQELAFFHREGASTFMPDGDDLITNQSEYDATDRLPVSAISVPDSTIMTVAAHTITVRGYDFGNSSTKFSQASLAVISMELATGAGDIVLTPDPIVVPIALPSVSLSFGALVLTPDPIVVPISLPPPTIAFGALIVTPDPIVVPVALPDPTVAFGVLTLTPSPIVVPIALPNILVDSGAAPITITPDPIVVAISLPDITLGFGAKTLTPDPIVVPIALPVPSISIGLILTPDPIVVPISLPSIQVNLGPLTLTPDPIVVTISLPDVAVEAGSNYIFSGSDIAQINMGALRSDALFKYAAVLQAGGVGQSGRSWLFNITDGVGVSGSEVTYSNVASTDKILYVSGTFILSGNKQYRPQHKADNPGEKCVWHSSKYAVIYA